MKPRLLILQQKTAYAEHLKRHVTVQKERSYLVEDFSKDIHTHEGIIKKKYLTEPDGTLIQSSKGKEFLILTANFRDLFDRIKKLPQTIPAKDLGWVAARTGMNKETIVYDFGGGSGAASSFFARLCKKVVCFEVRKDHCKIIEENLKRFSIKNVTLVNADVIKENIRYKNADVVHIDLPNPFDFIDKAVTAVKIGGYIVNYSPPIVSTQKVVNLLNERSDIRVEETVEIIQRQWKVKGEAVRPTTPKINHSGFLTIARRMQ